MYSQVSLKNTPEQDSVKIHFKQLVSATQAMLELRNLKQIAGLTQEQMHQKDVALQFYERGYNKYMKSDSINTILLKNKDAEINTFDIMYKQEMRERKLETAQKVGLAVSLPVAMVLSFLFGFYLHK